MKQRCGEAMVERAEDEEAMFICSDLQDAHAKPHWTLTQKKKQQ